MPRVPGRPDAPAALDQNRRRLRDFLLALPLALPGVRTRREGIRGARLTQDEIIEMGVQAGIHREVLMLGRNLDLLTDFAKLVAATERRELQGQLDAMHTLYELACRQRDFLMDQQRAELFAARGKLQ